MAELKMVKNGKLADEVRERVKKVFEAGESCCFCDERAVEVHFYQTFHPRKNVTVAHTVALCEAHAHAPDLEARKLALAADAENIDTNPEILN